MASFLRTSGIVFLIFGFFSLTGFSQPAYFFPQSSGFDPAIPSPESFLGYPIGSQHTRHDRIVAYMQELARVSDKARYQEIGKTYELRPLIILTITHPENHKKLEAIRIRHLDACDPAKSVEYGTDQPVLVNLGYNVHGNEPSSSEAAMLAAYYLVASRDEEAQTFLREAVVLMDPVLNPDGRDRHTHWANMHKGSPPVADPLDREHNEAWPGGRTNHYWFDLNRDWLLGVHPESNSKLAWYHQWLPHVVTDFHEMGSGSTHFFEPMKANGSKDPIMPKENYTTLNERFADYFVKALDEIGSLYFAKEVFDGTYPGYGSSYPDLQGGLGLLFEQASSRGHVQQTATGKLTFPFTIRNQLTSSLATLRAAVNEKALLFSYQRAFFTSAIERGKKDPVKAYVFWDSHDKNRNKAFLELLLKHQIAFYPLTKEYRTGGKTFMPGSSWIVPTEQAQYRMVQTMFETYSAYTDSVFYDASAWSLANAYGLPYTGISQTSLPKGEKVTTSSLALPTATVQKSTYAYLLDWSDYYAPEALYYLQTHGVIAKAGFKPFEIAGNQYGYGTILIPVVGQAISSDSLHRLINAATALHQVSIIPMATGYSQNGIDLGSGNFRHLKQPKALMLVGEGVSGYEAGEVWHLLDKRVNMPITKVDMPDLGRIKWSDYREIVLVSGSYHTLDSNFVKRLKQWVSEGGTLITTRTASQWAINKKIVKESLVKAPKQDSIPKRKPYVQAREIRGARQVGGTIFNVNLDITHPIGFGYPQPVLPVYRNSSVILKPSKNPYSTVAQYLAEPHVDGYVSQENLKRIRNSASVLTHKIGRGRVILFADNPNFRGTWYGTNKLFLNALFLGNVISVPD